MIHYLAITMLAALLMTSPCLAAGLEDISAYGYGGYFSWQEYNDAGSRVARETGPVFGAGAAARVDLLQKSLILHGKAELFGTVVDYEGRTQGSNDPAENNRPVGSDTRYFGGKIEGDLGWRVSFDGGSLEPFFGIGYRTWLRDIDSSTSTTEAGTRFPVGGATEYWDTIYTRYGLKGEVSIGNETALFLEAGAKYPLYTRNEAQDTSAGDVTLEPRSDWSAFAELGILHKVFRPAIFYEGFRFRRSPVEERGIFQMWQPKSDSDIVGISFAYSFH
ncbi:hypothetical protein KI811_01425 [Geobacter hydrogenophilus]|uniref:Outer membrane protein beta-barrel domain-containing protein n=1 Tax=Geobacter hydrogenophilus TaxID=40983 RepID=A0A9W6G2Q4_9BACT|nr:hypothetical protein [Geobacter hydrogenophilus]MBT0892480.1 hypothetical protein [Geobacter hydrogenophilus]GLI39875.1 hypothetical protein GHYDROH2_33760 [Geobacter hydrogenophilus]